jgi:type IX secretion system substrate protein
MKRIITVLFITLSIHAFSTVRLVPSKYSTIQSALNAAKTGDTILVAAGTYHENIIWPQTNSLHLLSDNPSKNSAVINGSDSARVININWSGSGIFNAEVNGFVIKKGFVNVPAHQGGRGAGMYASNAVLKIENCVFEKNNITSAAAIQNSGSGAALHIESTPKKHFNSITNCVFRENSITEVSNGWGTAIDLDNAPANINNVTVSNNSMSIDDVADGTIYAYQSDIKMNAAKIKNNTIVTNESILQGSAAIKGGGIFIYLSDAILTNILIDSNQLTPQNTGLVLLGSGIYFYGEGSLLTVLNSTIANNVRTDGATINGAAIYYSTTVASRSAIVNSILWNPGKGNQIYNQSQKASASYCDILGGYNGISNINSDPKFISATNYRLKNSSPCLNIGNNKFALATDLDGNKRPAPAGTNVDLGCYENDQNAIASAAIAKNFDQSIYVYPNPSNGKFKLVVPQKFIGASIEIANADGKIIFNGKIESREFGYDFSNKTNGIYYLTLKNSMQEEKTVKLAITK